MPGKDGQAARHLQRGRQGVRSEDDKEGKQDGNDLDDVSDRSNGSTNEYWESVEEADELLAVQEYEIAGGFVKLGP
ncbi:hypothetical protein L915_15609, partial [Phytophthora nicotianae]